MVLGFCLIQTSQAQLPHGAAATDWTLDDTDGNTHHLFGYLNSGKSAILKFSATWCGPCWTYHQTHTLDNVYDAHGPGGTDEVRVFYIESSPSTNEACLFGPSGCSGGTQGDWSAGTSFPLIHLEGADLGIPSQYGISFYPTLYAVSPDARLYELPYTGGANPSVAVWESWILESFKLDANATITDATCGDGAIDIEPIAGFGALSYQWSNGATTQDLVDLEAGTYDLTITDAHGYDITKSYTLNGPPGGDLLIDLVSQTDITCFGDNNGVIEVSGVGGWGNFTYDWSNGATGPIADNLSFGPHAVTITDNGGCTKEESYFIDEPLPVSATAIVTHTTCGNADGQIDINADGGVFPYNYELDGVNNQNGVFTDLAAGPYVAMVTDANLCQYSYSFDIDPSGAPTASVAKSNDLTCITTTATVTGSGSTTGSNVTYQWTTTNGNIVSGANELNAVVDAAGDYTLEVFVGSNCSASNDINVAADTNGPSLGLSPDTELTCVNTTATLCATVPSSAAVDWRLNGVSVGNTACINVTSAGNYEAIATGLNGCTTSGIVLVDQSDDTPQISVDAPATLTCAEPTTVLNAQVVGDPSLFSFVWSTFDGAIVSGGNTPNPTVNQGGSYSVQVTETATGCSANQVTNVVSEANTPEPSFTYSLVNGVLTLANTSGSDQGLEWNFGNGSTSNNANETITYNANGTYTVCLSISNDCGPGVECIDIPYAVALTSVVATTNVQCFGDDNGSLMITPAGGEGNYTIAWTGPNGYTSSEMSLSDLAPGEYAYVLDDSFGYQITGSHMISQPDQLLANAAGTDVLCFGDATGAIDISQQGGVAPYAFMWNDGNTSEDRSDLAAGTYSIVITDSNNCSVASSLEITQPTEVVVTDVQIIDAMTGQDNGAISITVDGGVAPYTYLWSNGATTRAIDRLAAGTYSLVIVDANGCESRHEYEVKMSTGLVDLSSLLSVDVFPNPATDHITIQIQSNEEIDLDIKVYTMEGKLVASQGVSGSLIRTTLATHDLKTGMYLVRLNTYEGAYHTTFIKL